MATVSRQILYVGPHGLIALRAARNGWQVTGRFAAVDGGATHAAFAEWLRRHPRDTFELIADVIDEEQHADALPRTRQRDQRLLVAKRLQQRFREAEFSLATPLAATSERRANRAQGRPAPAEDASVPVLLSAIRGAASLAPWVPVLRASERGVSSLLSPALLSARVAKRIAPHASGMLVCVGPAGLRQTVILAGRLRFSRLTATIDGSDLGAVRAEVLRTAQYLQMSQAVPGELLTSGRFNLWLVTDGIADADRIASTLSLDSGARMPVSTHALASLGAAEVRDADGAPASLGALPLWLDARLRRPAGTGYANASLRRFHTIARIRQALWAAGGAAIAASTLLLAGVEIAAFDTLRDPAQVEARRAQSLAERVALERRLAGQPVSGSEMEALSRTADALLARTVDAPALLRTVSVALPADTDLRVTELAWSRAAPGGGTAPPGAGSPGVVAPGPGAMAPGGGLAPPAGMVPPSGALSPVGALPPVGGLPPVGAPGPGAAGPTGASATRAALAGPVDVVLKGTVAAHRSKSDANELVERLSTALAEGCGCSAEVRQWPYDRGPASSLSEDLAQPPGGRTVPFSVTLRMADASATRGGGDAARR